MIQTLLLTFLGSVLFVFCVIDLWHLKEMRKLLIQLVDLMKPVSKSLSSIENLGNIIKRAMR